MDFAVTRVREEDLADLLPLMRGYCDFYEIDPSDERLLRLSRMLLENPEHDGLQLLVRDPRSGVAIGFATLYWTFSTHATDRIGLMNDLFVEEFARGTGVADSLIAACADECRARGAAELVWQTAKDNARAQAVYERMGAERSEWLDFTLAL
jgi:GNAT superfamily N-acetyltransferase